MAAYPRFRCRRRRGPDTGRFRRAPSCQIRGPCRLSWRRLSPRPSLLRIIRCRDQRHGRCLLRLPIRLIRACLRQTGTWQSSLRHHYPARRSWIRVDSKSLRRFLFRCRRYSSAERSPIRHPLDHRDPHHDFRDLGQKANLRRKPMVEAAPRQYLRLNLHPSRSSPDAAASCYPPGPAEARRLNFPIQRRRECQSRRRSTEPEAGPRRRCPDRRMCDARRRHPPSTPEAALSGFATRLRQIRVLED